MISLFLILAYHKAVVHTGKNDTNLKFKGMVVVIKKKPTNLVK
jgi:hypothetical protein